MRLGPTSVSQPRRRARRTLSAVAAPVSAARAPLVLLGRCCATEVVFLTAAPKDRASTPVSAPALLSALTSESAPAEPPNAVPDTPATQQRANVNAYHFSPAPATRSAAGFRGAVRSASTAGALPSKGKRRAGLLHREPGPSSSCPYSLKCVEQEFSEVHVRYPV